MTEFVMHVVVVRQPGSLLVRISRETGYAKNRSAESRIAIDGFRDAQH